MMNTTSCAEPFKHKQRQLFRRSGSIWRNSHRVRSFIVNKVCTRLVAEYGTPRLGNPVDPLDDLIYIVLSNRTSAGAASRTFKQLKYCFRQWDALCVQPLRVLKQILKPIGLSQVRAVQIRSALRKIQRDFGICDLSQLRHWADSEAEAYLVTLPGVSLKVAKCVAMYTLGARVLPVDAHVYRVACRLGWVCRRRADQCHEELEAIVPPQLRYDFHVDCIVHGRTVCRAVRPSCDTCCIRRYCKYFQERKRGEWNGQ